MRNLLRRIAAPLMFAALTLPVSSCKKRSASSTTHPNVVRIAGVEEPPELLVPGEQPAVHTPELDAFAKAIENIKGGSETAGLPDLNRFIAKYPNVADAYAVRSTLHCITGDLQGAREDLDKAISEPHHLLPGDPKPSKDGLLAVRAKLAYIAHDDASAARDLHTIISSYNSDFLSLTDGRVKLTDKPNSVCAWTSADIADLLKRTSNAPDAQVFRLMFVSAFAPLDDNAKELTQRYTDDALKENPSSASVYFYAARGIQKSTAYKALAFSDEQRGERANRLIALWSKVIQLDPSVGKAFAERADSLLNRKEYSAAIRDYDQAIAFFPEDAGLWNDRGSSETRNLR